MEKRIGKVSLTGTVTKSSPLPVDFIKMVQDVFGTHFDEGLKALAKIKDKPRFEVSGAIYDDEVVLSVALTNEGRLAATTVHGSLDFDPKASAPTVQDLLGAAVDAVGTVFATILTPARIEQVAEASLSAFEDVPFEWTAVEVERYRVFVKVDKSNPKLEQMADEWLTKNDPRSREEAEAEEKETEQLFVTGDKAKKAAMRGGGTSGPSGMTH